MPGLEPGTSSLSVTRSNQLSYTPVRATGVIVLKKVLSRKEHLYLKNSVVQIKRQSW